MSVPAMIEHLRAVDRDRFGEGAIDPFTAAEMTVLEKSLRAVKGIF